LIDNIQYPGLTDNVLELTMVGFQDNLDIPESECQTVLYFTLAVIFVVHCHCGSELEKYFSKILSA